MNKFKFSLLCLSVFALTIASAAIPLRGFNTNAFLYNFSDQKFTSAYIDTLSQLQPDILRFPGGTIANKYHFRKSGYGQDSNFDRKTAQNYIVEFVRLVKSMEQPPKVLYVINMFEHFHKPTVSDWDLIVENLAAILYLKKQGVEIVGVELGNEFYIYPVIRGWDIKISSKTKIRLKQEQGDDWWPDTYKKYNRLAQLYHRAIKKIDPEILTGIPMGSSVNKNHKKWNAFAYQMKFSDAYIQHWYGQLSEASAEDIAEKNFNRFAKRVEDNIREVKSTEKQLWITEWNGIDFGFKNNRNTHLRQTDLHSKFNLRLQTIFDSMHVEMTIYHRVSSGKEGDTYNLFNVENGKIIVNNTYWDFIQPPYRKQN
ncbi:MAG TPA: hypothetical protein VFD65_06290 [Chitinophagales bacterium]|nr:hypothetical protein [Chitinophagales bacterium]